MRLPSNRLILPSHPLTAFLRRIAVPVLSLIVCTFSTPSPAQQFNETELKAAYLYNFAYFITWPEPAAPEFLFCSYANTPVTAILSRLVDGEKVHDRPIRLLIDPLPEQLHECHIVFIPAQQERVLATTLDYIHAFPVLTVSDIPDFDQRGGMVRLTTEDRRIQPVIHLQNVSRARLSVSSKLLRSSRITE